MADRFLGLIEKIVLHLTARFDLMAAYPAKIVAQNSDGTLELKPESESLPSVSRVPIRLGLPGCRVKVKAGGRVLLTFEEGDPRRPVATLWDTTALEEISIVATGKVKVTAQSVELKPNGRPIACQGDMVRVGGPILKPTNVMFGAPGVPVQPGGGATGPTPMLTGVPYAIQFFGGPSGAVPTNGLTGQIVGAVGPNKS